MSYGHANHLTHSGTEPDEWYPSDATMADKPGDIAVLAPDWYARPELAPVLISHNIGALFRWLSAAGLPQRRIAALISSTQPQVADIIAGRRTRVQSYDVLVRTAAGLRIPRERMGLSFWGPDGTWYGPPYAYPEGVATAHTPKGVTSAMLRRHLIAFGGTVMAGVPVPKLGEPLDALGTLPPVPLPSRLSHRDVVRVWDTTRRLAEAGNSCLCDPQTLSDAAARMTQLLDVPGRGVPRS